MPSTRLRVAAIGDAIVDFVSPPMEPLPRGDVQAMVSGFAALPGGNATNFALAIAALGARATFVGAVGRDPEADLIREAFRRGRVRPILRTDPERRTGLTFALTWKDGTRALITAPGANGFLLERDVPTSIVNEAQHVHRAGYWWTAKLVGEPSARILARARRAGATTSLDISTDPDGWRPGRIRAVRACLSHVDTFFGNEIEIRAIGGRRSLLDAARRICARGPGEVVLHRGERGAMRVTAQESDAAPAFRVRIDNPTGCGDVFNASYVLARFRGLRPRDALRFGNACAALHLRDRETPYPSRAAVERFLAA
jgi:hypothetical protein